MTAGRFCSQCGTKLLAEATFCVECGARTSGAKAKDAAAPSAARYAPVMIVVVVLLIAGGAIALGLLRPKTPPSVPGRQPGTSAPAAAPGAGVAMPEGHPPVTIPDDVKQTLREMAKSAQAEPDNLSLWKQLAEAQYRAGQIDPTFLAEAELSLQHILDRDPQNAEVLRNLGNVAFDRDQAEKAITYYSKYLELKPDDPDVMTDMNTMRLAAGQTDAAIAGYQQVLAKNPTFFQAHFNLGLAYSRAGKTAESIAALEKARELAADDRARQQVDQVIARTKGEVPSSSSSAKAPAAPAGSLREGIEEYFRSSQIMASRVDRFDWTNDRSVKVMLRDFPMTGMPDFVRQQMLDRIRARIKEQKTAHHVADEVQVLMVDSGTGETMETVRE